MRKVLSDPLLRFLLIWAILIRLLVMPFYLHPDSKIIAYQTSFLSRGVTNIYDYLSKNPNQLNFAYPPLVYFFEGGYQFLISPFLDSHYLPWVSSSDNSSPDQVFRYIFLLKIPLLICDLAIAFMLYSFFEDKLKGTKAFLIWAFNPLSIIVIYLYSNIDVYAATFSILSLLLLKKRKFLWAGLFLGIGAAFKVYPLLFIPLLFVFNYNRKQITTFITSCLGIFLITILPFIRTGSFLTSLNTGAMTRIFNNSLGLGFGEALYPGVIILVAIFLYLFWNKVKEIDGVWVGFLALLLILFSFIHFHIQWLVWILPYAVLVSVVNRKVGVFLWISLGLASLVPLLYQDPFMSSSLLLPVSSLYVYAANPFDLAHRFYDPFVLQGTLQSLFLGVNILVIWRLMQAI